MYNIIPIETTTLSVAPNDTVRTKIPVKMIQKFTIFLKASLEIHMKKCLMSLVVVSQQITYININAIIQVEFRKKFIYALLGNLDMQFDDDFLAEHLGILHYEFLKLIYSVWRNTQITYQRHNYEWSFRHQYFVSFRNFKNTGRSFHEIIDEINNNFFRRY